MGKMAPIEMGIEHFEMMKVLGKGTFGKVMLAKQKTTGGIFAIKVLKKSMVLEKDELAHTLTENAVLAKCRHPFLTELRSVPLLLIQPSSAPHEDSKNDVGTQHLPATGSVPYTQ